MHPLCGDLFQMGPLFKSLCLILFRLTFSFVCLISECIMVAIVNQYGE